MNRKSGYRLKLKVWVGSATLALALAITALPASADSVSVVLKDVGGANQGGVYVVPYFLSIAGAPNIVAMCDDFEHHVSINQRWDANVSTFGDLSLTRWRSPFLTQYKEEAWLLSSFFAHPGEAGDINFAAWAIFTPSVKTNAGYTARSDYWFHQAESQNFADFDLSGYRIITPTNLGPSGAQEYITKVPEPSNLTLVGIGMLALALVTRRSWNAKPTRQQLG